MNHINLEEFAAGALTAQINRAMEDVTKNVQDPNTDATATRKITVTIVLKPNDRRDFVATGVQTKTTLAPVLGAVTAISMGKNLKTGEVEAVEVGRQIPGQMSISDMEEQETHQEEKTVRTVDPSTGEIYETPTNNVIDLRQARHA
ncbi:hypothetical protein MR857_13365 [bacterium]|nr:hypothetical protein [bacterium]MDY3022396.1 hypothetical protein [Oliverpabstia sp.]